MPSDDDGSSLTLDPRWRSPDGPYRDGVAWPADETWVATADGDQVSLWDTATRTRRWRTEVVLVKALVAARDGSFLVTSAEDPDHGAFLGLWDAVTGTLRHEWYTTEGLSESPDLLLAPDGSWLATAGRPDTAVRIWHTGTGESADIAPGGVDLDGWHRPIA